MATYINGTDMIVSLDDTSTVGADAGSPTLQAIAAATSCTLTIEIDAPEMTVKANNDKKEFTGLSTSWTIDTDALYTENASAHRDFYSMYQAGYGDGTTASDSPVIAGYPRRVFIQFKGTSGGDIYKGYAYITSMSATGGAEDASTMSVSFQGTGDLEYA